VFFGEFAGTSTTTHNVAVGIGTCALRSLTGGGGAATAVGYEALMCLVNQSSNTAVGQRALKFATGGFNTAVGSGAMSPLTTGIENVAVGVSSMTSGATITGSYNVAMGSGSLASITSGSRNIAIGHNALTAMATGDSNSALGAETVSGGFSASVLLGRCATATASNQMVFGSSVAGLFAGTVATESLTSDRSWAVRINGTAYKILLKA
jgi:hypothetical protein